jgi:hypothetical protein
VIAVFAIPLLFVIEEIQRAISVDVPRPPAQGIEARLGEFVTKYLDVPEGTYWLSVFAASS